MQKKSLRSLIDCRPYGKLMQIFDIPRIEKLQKSLAQMFSWPQAVTFAIFLIPLVNKYQNSKKHANENLLSSNLPITKDENKMVEITINFTKSIHTIIERQEIS